MTKKTLFRSYFLFLAVVSSFLSSCEDLVDVKIEEGKSQLAVDAVLTNKPIPQVIKLTKTIGYFNNKFAPPVLNATVIVTDNEGKRYEFTDPDKDGRYTWTPKQGEVFGEIGKTYQLYINAEGEEYEAYSQMRRIPRIDSIYLERRKARPALNEPAGIYAELFVRDLKGPGDCYWIRTYKNGIFLNKPQEIGLSYDGAFSAGTAFDGLTFIRPVREFINPVRDEKDPADQAPYNIGDSIYVDLLSITPEMWFYMLNLQEQLQNGGLFATPV
ncbi:MAG: DUF4249 domain-containing protein, partial [Flammeovirgaceae bacterium]|nr:DUF4249 domain-containing protein [Flammeovirgaceae bacterium]MDW8287091.1 DUF4249 domain-containing protein [Flammeovirgaceae bacterium]